ncbi:metallophosphoesterase family protein [Flavobacterium gelatinilyticum]|uniref:metallophosphoesterase family protein n=1 Tax=Flavobacterium gelatinilyticum TaxID=3003260 RepID=UPI00248021DC|nr:metallophosphoesterase [Flavobacterium gelatinilyticum]
MPKITLLTSLLCCLLVSCDMFDYHPYDGKITGERNINEKNIKRIEAACLNKDTIRFAVMGDTQRWYDETQEFVNTLNKRNDIDFVIHLGDITDFGLTKEFLWMRDIMNKLYVPYVVLLGNHDCLANGQDVFRSVFGNENFSFTAGTAKFICMNTNALEFDYSHPVPDFNFLQQQFNQEDPKHKKTIFAMHVQPGSEQFNNNVDWVFQDALKRFPNVQFCINGHDHRITAKDLFNDGLMYYGSTSINKKSYLIFTLTPDNRYSYEVVYF